MDTVGLYRDAPLSYRLQSLLAVRLKKSTTLFVVEQPHACPSCCCERFERQASWHLDHWLGRLGRYRCEKCFAVTLHLPQRMLEAAQLSHQSAGSAHGVPDEGEHLFDVATRYATGNGEVKNMGAAFTLYARAARMGHAKAQYNVGVCYIQGITVTRDLREGADWVRRAARQGHTQAKLALPSLSQCIEFIDAPSPRK